MDYDKALIRADNYARWTDAVIRRLREGVAAGVVLPRIVVERMLPQLQAHLGIEPERTQFWHPVATLPALHEFLAHVREDPEQHFTRPEPVCVTNSM